MKSFDFTLKASATGTVYRMQVVVPGEDGSGPWPSMLFLDGDDQFKFARDAYRSLRDRGAVPATLLVGIGYGASYREPANRRGRDYTPTAHTDEPSSGGGETFLRFVEEELWPDLARRHPLEEGLRGIAGHSLGSLLVLHALFRARPFFTHFLASAPSIWWDDRAILRQVAALRETRGSLPARLFLGVGENDSESMTTDLARLARQLDDRPFADLCVARRTFRNRDHYDVLPDAFAAGLENLLGRNDLPTSAHSD